MFMNLILIYLLYFCYYNKKKAQLFLFFIFIVLSRVILMLMLFYCNVKQPPVVKFFTNNYSFFLIKQLLPSYLPHQYFAYKEYEKLNGVLEIIRVPAIQNSYNPQGFLLFIPIL